MPSWLDRRRWWPGQIVTSRAGPRCMGSFPHYGITIIPSRVRKPKDKAAVDGAVKIVEMRILATARDRVFESLDVLNTWFSEAPSVLHAAPFQKHVGSLQRQLSAGQP